MSVWLQPNTVTRASEEPQPTFYVVCYGHLLRAAQLAGIA